MGSCKESEFDDKPLCLKVCWLSPLNRLLTPSDVGLIGFLFIGFAPFSVSLSLELSQ